MRKSTVGCLVALSVLLLSNTAAKASESLVPPAPNAGLLLPPLTKVVKTEDKELDSATLRKQADDASKAKSYFVQGATLYQHGRYEEAMPLLERAAAGLNDADSHYYLADTYFRLSKNADALREYQISYELNPHSYVSGFCQQMIHTLTSYKNGRKILPPANKRTLDSQETRDIMSKATNVDPDKLQMPGIPGIPTSVDVGEVQHWDYIDRVKFLPTARDQVNKAEIAVKTSEDVLKQAQRVARALVPRHRAWGETEKNYLARVGTGQSETEDKLEPYVNAVAESKKALNNSRAVLSMCQQAGQGLDGIVPTTLGIDLRDSK